MKLTIVLKKQDAAGLGGQILEAMGMKRSVYEPEVFVAQHIADPRIVAPTDVLESQWPIMYVEALMDEGIRPMRVFQKDNSPLGLTPLFASTQTPAKPNKAAVADLLEATANALEAGVVNAARAPKGTPTDTNKFALNEYLNGENAKMAPRGVITRVHGVDLPHLKRMVAAGWLEAAPGVKGGWVLSAVGKRGMDEWAADRAAAAAKWAKPSAAPAAMEETAADDGIPDGLTEQEVQSISKRILPRYDWADFDLATADDFRLAEAFIESFEKKHGKFQPIKIVPATHLSSSGGGRVALIYEGWTGEAEALQFSPEMERLMRKLGSWFEAYNHWSATIYGDKKRSASTMKAKLRATGFKLSAAMSDAEFWDVIADIGWDGKSQDWDKIKKKLLTTLSPDQIESLNGAFEKAKGGLYKKIDLWEKEEEIEAEEDGRRPRTLGLGDDSFSDLISHIVGLGKAEYDAVMKNPELAYKRAVGRGPDGFTESFSYAIPFKSDLDNLSPKKYIEWAQRLVDEGYPMEASPFGGGPKTPQSSAGKAAMKITQQALKLLADGDVAGFLGVETEVVLAVKLLRKEIGTNEWAVLNLYSDIKKYLDV